MRQKLQYCSLRRLALLPVLLALATAAQAGVIGVQQTQIGIQAGELELQDLGFDPSAFFFFSGNTGYEYEGRDVIRIIAAALNPVGATSLEGVTIREVTFVVDSSGAIVDMSGAQPQVQDPTLVPEPTAFRLFAVAVALAWAWRYRTRTIRSTA